MAPCEATNTPLGHNFMFNSIERPAERNARKGHEHVRKGNWNRIGNKKGTDAIKIQRGRLHIKYKGDRCNKNTTGTAANIRGQTPK